MTREERRAKLKKRFKKIHKAFIGEYADELKALQGLSQAEIGEITPDNTDIEIYRKLIAIVEEASVRNFTQAELLEDIQELGKVAVTIAKKVPVLVAKIGL
ncbi:MAG: hypothetical protein JKX79_06320 [Labilibaculum sp.]|nr:hypothetical protein [Labilibaculum sp.]